MIYLWTLIFKFQKAFSSESSMEGPDIRNYFSRNRSISDPEGRIYSQPQDLDEQLEADLGKFQPITNNEKLNQVWKTGLLLSMSYYNF